MQRFQDSPSRQQVHTGAFELAGTGPGQDEAQYSIGLHLLVDNIEKRRDFLDLVDDHRLPAGIPFDQIDEMLRSGRVDPQVVRFK